MLAAVIPERTRDAAAVDVTRLLRRAGEYLLSRGGDPRAALPLFERAHQLSTTELNADDPETVVTTDFLASVLNTLGEHDKAGELNRQTLENRLETLGPDHPSTLRAATNHAIYLRSVHQNARAAELNEDAFSRASRSLGPDHSLTLAIANGLAINLSAIGRPGRARELDEDTLARSGRLLGDDHPDTLSTAHNLGNDLRRLGEYELARRPRPGDREPDSGCTGREPSRHPRRTEQSRAGSARARRICEQARELNTDIHLRCAGAARR